MPNPNLLAPVEGDDPCGPDLRWDPAFNRLAHALQAAVAQGDDSVLDAERVGSNAPAFEEVVEMAEALGRRTKDLRVVAVYAEARWRDKGLPAFADAMEDLAAMVETWPDPDTGIHPRADEEDGDLGERAAPLGRLLNGVPALASIVGWGGNLEISERAAAGATLRDVFERWDERLGPAFGPDVPSCRDAWGALSGLVGEASEAQPQAGADETGAAAMPGAAPPQIPAADAWDAIERAAELMARQDRHSPALPVLRMLAGWRSLGIIEISDALRMSGVTLEQLLESIKRQLQPPG